MSDSKHPKYQISTEEMESFGLFETTVIRFFFVCLFVFTQQLFP